MSEGVHVINMSEKRFRFVNEKDVVDTRENNVPANTKKHTLWSANCYGKWAEVRETEFRDFEAEYARFQTIPKLSEITVDEMNYWLIIISDEDSVLVNACIDYERSQSHIDIGGILQGELFRQ